ncbi:MAG: pro-sigmaK processing inhibitor BofA family protein [Candidatus Micrarchaeaceae archaeon]
MVAIPPTNTLLGEIVLIALIAVVLFIIFKIGKTILKLILGIIINSVLGLAAIFILNYFFGLGIPVKLYTLIPTALFGLPAVGTFVILRFFGILALIL